MQHFGGNVMVAENTIVWETMVRSFANNPRDVQTVPLSGGGIWFFVYAEYGNIYVESGRNHTNSSIIRNRRRLEKEKTEKMLSIYHRRSRGEAVAQEAKATTQNQVYWYGIFADLKL